MMSKQIPVLFFCFLLIAPDLCAQKVTLVLSGGGAKGLAHVGVLKALEENNIPIDNLVGTSMGGIVAGCYAAGFTPAEIEEIMTSPEFLMWVNGQLDVGYNYFYSKEDPNPSIVSVEFSLDSTMHAALTSSLASDLSLNFALAEKFAQPSANANYNFDSLFVPARIIASDIFTQNEVILRKGSLAAALRTSLSVPFFYKPIRIDGKYLFDGGIYNNFPVDVAKDEFESDVLIGVNVSSKVFKEYPFDQDDRLLQNSLIYMLLDKSDPSRIPENGIYIEPDLGGYTAFDFKRSRAMIDSGYVWTMNHMDEIKEKIGRRSDTVQLSVKRKEFKDENKPLRFTGVDMHGFNSKQRKYIYRLFGTLRKDVLDFGDIKEGYYRMVSEQYFSTIYPDILYDNKTDGFRLNLYGRPRSNLIANLGGVIASRNISQVYLGMEYYYFSSYLLKLSLDFQAGNFHKSGRFRAKINFPGYRPLYLEPEFLYNNWNYIDADDLFLKERDATFLESLDRRYGLNFGFPIATRFKGVVTGAYINNQHRYSNANSLTTADTLDLTNVKGYRFGVGVSSNSLNKRQYANDGRAIRASLNYFNVNEEYMPGSTASFTSDEELDHAWFRLNASMEQYFRQGWYSTGFLLNAVVSNQPSFINRSSTLINAPAFEPLNDSRTLFLQKFRANNYVAAGLRNVFSLNDIMDVRLEVYAFKSFPELLFRKESTSDHYFNEDLSIAGSVGLVVHSPIGPVSLSANYYDDDETPFGVLLHVGFMMFNKRSLD